jgi:transposase
MKTNAVLGLDAAQAGVCYHLEDAEGRCLQRGQAAKSTRGWTELKDVVHAHGLHLDQCLVAVESTGPHHLPWCEAFSEAGAKVLALNPLVAKRTTPVRNAIRDHKADPIDAEGVASTARREGQALERFSYHSRPAYTALREFASMYALVRRSLTNLKKHLSSTLELVFPEARALPLGEVRLRRLLLRAPTPARIAALSAAELRALVGSEAAAQVHASAKDSFAPAALAEACAPALQALLTLIEQIHAALAAIEPQMYQQATRAVSAEQIALARSLPGFGPKTTPVVLAFVPPELWTSALPRKKKLARLQAFFGIDPRRRESGKWKGKVKMSKRGCRLARTALYQIAFCSLLHDPEAHAYYNRLKREKHKPHRVAVFDVARKHLRRLVAVLESGQPYTPHHQPAAA